MTKIAPVLWDRHAIKAEIGRAGLTMTKIAKAADLEPSAVRHGLLGSNRRGAEAIARAIAVPFRELFPNTYLRGGDEPIRKAKMSTREKRRVSADVEGSAS